MSQIDPKELEERLAAMQSEWSESSAAFVPGDKVPEGVYQALIKDFDFFEGKNGAAAGKAFIKTVFQIQNEADLVGAECESIHNLEDPERYGFLKRHFGELGVDVDEIPMTELRPGSDTLRSLLDVPVEIAVKHSDKLDAYGNPYVNVYVNQRLGGPIGSDVTSEKDLAGATANNAGATKDDDGIPF